MKERIIRLNSSINESHGRFVTEINSLMKDEFRNFFSDCVKNFEERSQENSGGEDKEKISGNENSSAIVVNSETQIEEVAKDEPQKSKMVYASFYAKEATPENPEEIHDLAGKNLTQIDRQ